MLIRVLSAVLILGFALVFIWEGLSFGFSLEATLAAAFTAAVLAAEVVRRTLGGGDGPSFGNPQRPVLA